MFRLPIGIALMLSLVWLVTGLSAQEADRSEKTGAEYRGQVPFPAWVGLYGSAPLARLENENRINDLCTDSKTLSRCYRETLAPSVTSTFLHAGPDAGSAMVGEIIVIVVPGRALSAFYRPAGSSAAPAFFTPDLFLQDWGYGVYFHQTIAEQRADWFKLPAGPWPTPVWLHVPDGTGSEHVIGVQAGDIIEMEGAGWYVVSSGRNHLGLRPEQPRDMWCAEGDPPPIADVEPIRFPRTELLDADGHLQFRPKYMKGC
jgi:hypothetical protein